MPAKDLIDEIRHAAEASGVTMPITKGRDRISRLIYGVNYSPAIAAERMGKLPRPTISDSESNNMRTDLGHDRAKTIIDAAALAIGPARS